MGVESGWLPVATLELVTGVLWIGDSQFSWAEANEQEGCRVMLPNGVYQVEARGIDFAGTRLASRLRVRLARATEVAVGDEIGEAETDSAQVGVADPGALKSAFDAACGDDEDAALDLLEEGTESAPGVFEPQPGKPGRLVYVPSGLGDGGGPVLELLSAGERVGVEHAFIDSAEPF